ncbi:MAG: type 1 glutamine amidotransferase [Spirochaetia bacterium]|nr:type 1 glutamine amidotransferase [Spirochaetia bacterium]
MRVLFLRHAERVYPYNLEAPLAADGLCADTVAFPLGQRPAQPSAYAAVFVFGGYQSVNDGGLSWLRDERTYLEAVLKARVPVLGLCLGGQLLAQVLGASVRRADPEEFGWWDMELTPAGAASPLFRGVAPSFPAFLWHNESFDLPAGAELLARGAHWGNQAFAYGGRAFGAQFHVEFTLEHVRAMLRDDADQLPARGPAWQDPALVAANQPAADSAAATMLGMARNVIRLGGED